MSDLRTEDGTTATAGVGRTRLRASIVIPAHDEATVIGRLLSGIAELGVDHDVLVVANGCTDDTARVVAGHPWCRLVQIETASKPAALNAGDAAARAHPRVYLDADVSVEPATLRSLVAVLETEEAVVASPHVRIDHGDASLLARAYQRVWAMTDYRQQAHTGSGIYGLSRTGRERFAEFPAIISDDLYVRMLFAPGERRVTSGAPFTIHAPRTARAQVKRLSRTMAGELQLVQRYPGMRPDRGPGGARAGLLRRVARHPLLWPSFAVYAAIYGAGRIAARRKLALGRTDVWERDDTSR